MDYGINIEWSLRTLTINERFSHATHTANLPGGATPIAQDVVNVINNGALTPKSLQGTIYYGALAGRTLGGQTFYFTNPVNGAATPFTVEPEHRLSFAIAPSDWQKTGQSDVLNLAKIIHKRVREGLYDGKLYKHGEGE